MHVEAVFDAAFHEFGLPRVIHTDNGVPFASRAPGGLSRVSIRWVKLGIVPQRSPASSQDNGRHERMHSTLKQATLQPPQRTARRQQQAFDRFPQEYNQERPHESLQDRTPASFYTPSCRPMPDERYFEVLYGPLGLGYLDSFRHVFTVRAESHSAPQTWTEPLKPHVEMPSGGKPGNPNPGFPSSSVLGNRHSDFHIPTRATVFPILPMRARIELRNVFPISSDAQCLSTSYALFAAVRGSSLVVIRAGITSPSFSRTADSIFFRISGCSFRNSRAVSRPCPNRSPA